MWAKSSAKMHLGNLPISAKIVADTTNIQREKKMTINIRTFLTILGFVLNEKLQRNTLKFAIILKLKKNTVFLGR